MTIQVTDTNEATAKADVKVLVRGEKADPDDDNNGNDNNGGNDNNSGNNNGGSHNNGSTSGSHSQSVQTGDNANVIMWAVLLVAAVAAVGAVVIIRRKKNRLKQMKPVVCLEQTAGFVIEIADGRGRIMYCMLICRR